MPASTMTRPTVMALTNALADANVVSQWDSLIESHAGGIYSTPSWHQTTLGLLSDNEFVACSRDEGGTVKAVIPCHRIGSISNKYLNFHTMFATPDVQAPWAPVLLLGSCMGYVTTFASSSTEAWAQCAASLLDQPDPVIAVPHLRSDDAHRLSRHFPDAPLLLSGLRVVLPIRGNSWDEHLAALLSRKRSRVKREHSRPLKGMRTLHTEQITPATMDEFANLIVSTQHHHGFSATHEGFIDFLQRIATSSLPHIAFVCRENGEAIAFNLCLRYRDTMTVRAVGLDYERTGQHGEYGTVLAHMPAQYAAENGITSINMGLEATDAKLQRCGEAHLAWTLLLRAPDGWTPAHTAAHNARKATEWLDAHGSLLGENVRGELKELCT